MSKWNVCDFCDRPNSEILAERYRNKPYPHPIDTCYLYINGAYLPNCERALKRMKQWEREQSENEENW